MHLHLGVTQHFHPLSYCDSLQMSIYTINDHTLHDDTVGQNSHNQMHGPFGIFTGA